MRDFKELKIWGKSYEFSLEIYKITKSFPREELYGLVSQIRRSATSTPANIAEGCGKSSKKDFARYLLNALGSAYETENHLLLCKDLNYINKETFNLLNKNLEEIKKMLASYIRTIQSNKDY